MDLQRFAWHPPFYTGFFPDLLPKKISAAKLKWIALVTMLIDHIGAAILIFLLRRGGNMQAQPLRNIYEIFRDIGRIAFPIYIFLLIEGLMHTRNRRRYLFRLFLFALISEIPFDLAFYHTPLLLQTQNVFFTLLIGLATVWCMESFEKELSAFRKGAGADMPPLIFGLYRLFLYPALILTGFALAEWLCTDYKGVGVLAICACYLLRRNPLMAAAACSLVLLLSGEREIYALGSLIPISLYNGKRGRQPKYFFYAFYPVHLILLWCIYCLL